MQKASQVLLLAPVLEDFRIAFRAMEVKTLCDLDQSSSLHRGVKAARSEPPGGENQEREDHGVVTQQTEIPVV